jgi:hypothetical protein
MKYLSNSRIMLIVKNRNGAFLAEVMIASVIAGILMVSLISMLQLVNSNSSRVTLGITKNQIANQIRLSALNLKSVESSSIITRYLSTSGLTPNIGSANNMVNSDALADCLPSVSSSGSCSKDNMTAGSPDELGYRFYLYNGILANPAAPETFTPSRVLAGEDVFYKVSGERCSQSDAASASLCPIKAEAWAEPYCQNFATTCSKAISLTIKYKISLRSDFTGNSLMAPISGEIYLPLTKGIQLSRLLSEDNTPIILNTNGIYSVQKYNYDYTPAGQPKGLRFEAILGNPTGLVSMRLRYRSLVGADAMGLLDNQVPPAILSKPWNDVPNHTVSLASAKSNQIINFGTQGSATTYGLDRSFKIGALTTDTQVEQEKYRWHYNAGVLTPPTEFKSGFYQFQVLSTDSNGNEIESMNYLTVRIVPRPQILVPSGQPDTTQERNCVNGQGIVPYTRDFADDEGLQVQTLTLDSVDVAHPQASGLTGNLTINFDRSMNLPAGEGSHDYNYQFTVSNPFSGRTVNGVTIPTTNTTIGITLKEKAVGLPNLSSIPDTLKVLQVSTSTTSTLEVGSCCTETPVASWDFPVVPDIGQKALSIQSPGAAVNCVLDSVNNKRICTKSITIRGDVETISESNDITSIFTFSTSTPNACNGGQSGVNVRQKSHFFKVVSMPGISFYLKESLWLNLPSETINSVSSITPPQAKVYVRIDFPPEENVTVGVYKSIDLVNPICTLTFNAGAGLNPVDKDCPIPSTYSGQLILQRISANIKLPAEPVTSAHKAKITDNQFTHTTCRANLNTIPASSIPSNVPSYRFDDYTNTSNYEMDNSPWGSTENAVGGKNDINLWTGGESKTFRCYDHWDGSFYGSGGNSIYNFNSSASTASTAGTFANNNQDHYSLHRYNREETKTSLAYPDVSQALNYSKFQTLFFRSALDINRPNIPWMFIVYHNGDPAAATFKHTPTPLIGGSNQDINGNTWTNFTADVCTGSSTLNTIKLYGVRLKVLSGDGGDMKAVNEVMTGSTGYSQPLSYYSYRFVCAHGRWNPFSRDYTTWQH